MTQAEVAARDAVQRLRELAERGITAYQGVLQEVTELEHWCECMEGTTDVMHVIRAGGRVGEAILRIDDYSGDVIPPATFTESEGAGAVIAYLQERITETGKDILPETETKE